MKKTSYALFFIFSLSGFSGLIYESIWSHYIKLVLGHAAYAQTLVLTIFMGGMALGAWLISRVSSRIRNPLLWYAVVEAIIGIFGVVFHQEFLALQNFLFEYALPNINSPTLAAIAKWSIATTMLLPQALLLGTTFPLMSSAIIRVDKQASGRTLAMLYFSNSMGAAIGVLFSGFILIEAVGLPGATLTAGIINILLALCVWIITRELASTEPAIVQSPRYIKTNDSKLLILVAMLTGTASFFYEIGWIRMLSLVLSSSVQAFELMLSAFIAGLALGSFLIRRKIDQLASPGIYLAWIQIIMGLLATATLPLYVESFSFMSFLFDGLAKTDSGYFLFNFGSHAIAMAIMFPATLMAGMTLPLITNILLKSGGNEAAIGKIYSANTVGAIVGILLAIHLVMPIAGVKTLITVGSSIDILLGIVLLIAYKKNWRANPKVTLPLTGVVVFMIVLSFTPFDRAVLSSGVYRFGKARLAKADKLMFYNDGKTASIALIKHPDGSKSIRTNGKTDAKIAPLDKPYSADEVTMVMAAIVPLALKSDARRVANIGMGSGLTSHALLAAQSIDTLDTIEIEQEILIGAKEFGQRVKRSFSDPRSSIHIDDAKSFFSNHQKKYDIIVSEPSNPWMNGVASLFSYEFYQHIQKHLENDGIFVQWLQLYEINMDNIASVIKALNQSFSYLRIYNTDDSNILILASHENPMKNLDPWIFSDDKTKVELIRVGIENMDDINIRYLGNRHTFTPMFSTMQTPMNSDYFPYLGYQAPKARYLQQNASNLAWLHINGVPVLHWLTGKMPQDNVSKHGRYFQFYKNRTKAKSIINFDARHLDHQKLRFAMDITNSCHTSDLTESTLVESFRIIATAINPYLPLVELESYWNKQINRCRTDKNSAFLLNWLYLHQGISQRNTETTLYYGKQVLNNTTHLTLEQINYIVTAMLTAAVAESNFETALSLIRKFKLLKNLQKQSLAIKMLVAITLENASRKY